MTRDVVSHWNRPCHWRASSSAVREKVARLLKFDLRLALHVPKEHAWRGRTLLSPRPEERDNPNATQNKSNGFPIRHARKEKKTGKNVGQRRVRESGKTATKDNVSERRFAQTHRLVHSVNRKRRMNIPKPIAPVAHLFCRLVKSSSRRKFGDHSENLSSRGRCCHTFASLIDSVPPVVGGW